MGEFRVGVKQIGPPIDYGSESPILMFETIKIHIGNQTIINGVYNSDSNPIDSPGKTDYRRRAAPWL
jgi:hypothetical protein